ncbi:MAG TPA: cytochrome c biogenesis CcdA family protein [Dongiaceae bacterium]|nr:cytochrome c biogenesis CcdA family protein [Dongiaceae bacterium]
MTVAVNFDLAAYGFGLLAGILTVLSPCVLPLLPIVFGSALAAHRFGAVALSLGLALSFVAVGLFVATIGFSLGLDGELFRRIGALLLLIFGLAMLFPTWQALAAVAFGHLPGRAFGDRLQHHLQDYRPVGAAGQLVLGLLLGAVWSPCVGPTLGAAATLAAQRQNLTAVAAMMLVFGLGASLPLLAIGLAVGRLRRARPGGKAGRDWRRSALWAGRIGKSVLGCLLILVALLILSGRDRQIESQLVAWSPDWLTELTTRY